MTLTPERRQEIEDFIKEASKASAPIGMTIDVLIGCCLDLLAEIDRLAQAWKCDKGALYAPDGPVRGGNEMKLHSNALTIEDIRAALIDEQVAGRIAKSVEFKILDPKGSRTHARAFEFQLSSWDHVPGDGRRVGNAGSDASMRGDDWAATYSEWGWLMAALYRADPWAIWGTVKHPAYE